MTTATVPAKKRTKKPVPAGWISVTEEARRTAARLRMPEFMVTELIGSEIADTVRYVQAYVINKWSRGHSMPLWDALLLELGSEDDALALIRYHAFKQIDHPERDQRVAWDLHSYLVKQRRRKRTAKTHMVQAVLVDNLPSPDSNPQDTAEQDERIANLYQIIDHAATQNPKLGQAMTLMLDGMTQKAAAQQVGMGESTLREALRQIRFSRAAADNSGPAIDKIGRQPESRRSQGFRRKKAASPGSD
jgi:hypothetical protein